MSCHPHVIQSKLGLIQMEDKISQERFTNINSSLSQDSCKGSLKEESNQSNESQKL